MRKVIGIVLFSLLSLNLAAQVDFRKVHSGAEMDSIWAEAAATNKPVFVDVFATWCGPCKWLDANVFSLEEAGDYMNREFISVKLDGESPFGSLFAMENGLQAYPSLFVFSSQKELLNMLVGAKPWEELQLSLSGTVKYYPVIAAMQKKSAESSLEREDYSAYIEALRMMDKQAEAEKLANTYRTEFATKKYGEEDIRTLAFYTDPGTESWELLTSDLKLLKKTLGNDLDAFIERAHSKTIELALKAGSTDLIETTIPVLKKLSEESEPYPVELDARAYISYYHSAGEFDALIKYIDTQYAGPQKDDHAWLAAAASNAVLLDPRNREMAEQGLLWFNQCLEAEETHDYYYNLALCKYFTDDAEGTIESLQKSLEFTDDQIVIGEINSIIEGLSAEMAQ